MNRNILLQTSQKKIKIACLIPMLLLGFIGYPSRVQAQESSNSTSTNVGKFSQETFPDNGAPTGRREGGASRHHFGRVPKILNSH